MNYYPKNYRKKDRLNDCMMCKKYPVMRNDACKTRMPTVLCNPNEPQYWVQPQMKYGLDPVFSNIYNGSWLCNYEPQQTINNELCQRNFEDCGLPVPFNQVGLTNLHSQMRPKPGCCINKNNYIKPDCPK